MNCSTNFVVLIERTAHPTPPAWIRAGLSGLLALSLICASLGFKSAAAQPGHRHAKLAPDLVEEFDETRAPKRKWARQVAGGRQVQAIVVSNSADPQLLELRAEVLRLGSRVASTRMEFVGMDGTLLSTGSAAYIVS